jgi:hypothetical protein
MEDPVLYALSVIEHSFDQGLVLAGYTSSYGAGNDDMMLVKTNSVGIELWAKTYGGIGTDRTFSLIEHSIDQGFSLVGYTSSYGAGSNDMMLVKTSSVGIELWMKTYGGFSYDDAHSVMKHSIDQGLVLVGQTTRVSVLVLMISCSLFSPAMEVVQVQVPMRLQLKALIYSLKLIRLSLKLHRH